MKACEKMNFQTRK